MANSTAARERRAKPGKRTRIHSPPTKRAGNVPHRVIGSSYRPGRSPVYRKVHGSGGRGQRRPGAGPSAARNDDSPRRCAPARKTRASSARRHSPRTAADRARTRNRRHDCAPGSTPHFAAIVATKVRGAGELLVHRGSRGGREWECAAHRPARARKSRRPAVASPTMFPPCRTVCFRPGVKRYWDCVRARAHLRPQRDEPVGAHIPAAFAISHRLSSRVGSEPLFQRPLLRGCEIDGHGPITAVGDRVGPGRALPRLNLGRVGGQVARRAPRAVAVARCRRALSHAAAASSHGTCGATARHSRTARRNPAGVARRR